MNGKIVSGTRREYCVELTDGTRIFCPVRKTLVTNSGPLFIGDNIVLDETKSIVGLIERTNLLFRPKIANLDYAVVVCSTYKPAFSSYLLDKFLTYLNSCHIKSLIVFTKMDCLNDKEKKEIEEIKKYYESIGFTCYLTSTNDKSSIETLNDEINKKVIAFMGQTGAGKSSLINMLDPLFERAVGQYSEALGRGKHQTKEVILLKHNEGLIGDTPGFSSFDLPLSINEASYYFPGFSQYALKCYYNNCIHINENKCLIKDKVSEGVISSEAYTNYLKIIKEIKEGRKDVH